MLSIAHIASEMTPFAKIGGLGDVVGALARVQSQRGHRVTVVMPAYQSIEIPKGWKRTELGSCEVPWGMGREPASFDVCASPDGGATVMLVRHEGERRFFDRPGIYDDPHTGKGYTDGAERFLFFGRAALEGLKLTHERYDVLHAHDHQAAWTPCFVRTHEADQPAFYKMATVFTIHNLGYQGIHDPWVLGMAGFGGELFYPSSPFEFWGRVNYMKVGLAFSDRLTTVSERYAKEIQSGDEFGFGLEGVLAKRHDDLDGILNGIDDTIWNPATDQLIPRRYSAECLDGKLENRRALAAGCGFAETDTRPIIGMVSRLVEQKGFDLIEEAVDQIIALDARFAVLGTGEPRYEELFRKLSTDHPDQFHYRAGHDEPFAHLIEAGSDLFLMPSRYEPCGLNQMYSLRYGTPPIVRATGGLADTVTEFSVRKRVGNGFLFSKFAAGEMLASMRRALAIYRQPELWRALQLNGMQLDFSWGRAADAYESVYAAAREKVAAGRLMTLDKVREMIRA